MTTPADEQLTARLPVSLTPSAHARVCQAAEMHHVSPGTMGRVLIMAALDLPQYLPAIGTKKEKS